MSENLNAIAKIIFLSLIISLFIKYGSPWFGISPSLVNVMIAVFLPSGVMTVLFFWRWIKGSEVS